MTLITPDQREAVVIILDEAGIDPRTVSAFGVTAQGYYEIQYDAAGNPIRQRDTRLAGGARSTTKVWREWPNQSVGSAVYQALNPQ